MPAREQSRLAIVSLGASTCLLLCALLGLDGVVAYALPMLALLVPLLAGRYPGEDILVRTIRSRGRRRHRRVEAPGSPPWPPVVAVRGGRLIATALATRPPPSSLPL